MINITIGDVWQLAAEISLNLEKLTNDIGVDKVQGFVTPTVRALELLEKMTEERSKLIEEAIIADKIIKSLKKEGSPIPETIESNEADESSPTLIEDNSANTEKASNQSDIAISAEFEKQKQITLTLEKRVKELSDDLRTKGSMVSGILKSLLDNLTNQNSIGSLDLEYSHYDIECTINELEKDCDTLENEANRLLLANRNLTMHLSEAGDEVPNINLVKKSFASELIEEDERPGPDGKEDDDALSELTSTKSEANQSTSPRYTLYELEEVLNEKNKYKERCFVLEEKLRELTGDNTITYQGLSLPDLTVVESPTESNGMLGNVKPASIRKLMTRFFLSPPDSKSILTD